MNKSKILIVEDDIAIQNLLKTTLKIYEYEFEVAKNGREAIDKFIHYTPNIVILDLGLPDMDGLEVVKTLRSFSETPIMILSARNQDSEKVKALDLGADDYLTKPFNIEEFLARIRALLRRIGNTKKEMEANNYINGDLTIDYDSRIIYVKNEEIHLTPIEFKILVFLSQNTGKVLTHNQILREIWGQAYSSDMQSLRVFMTALRKKIESKSEYKYIQTHVGVGYCMLRNE